MGLPYLARSTATQAVKRNIRFSEVAACEEPSRIAWRATRILARHTRDRAAERLADPQRFDRCPSLAERAVRRSPPPVCGCVSQAISSISCPGELNLDEAGDRKEHTTDAPDKVEQNMRLYTLCLKKVPTFKLSVTCQMLHDSQN